MPADGGQYVGREAYFFVQGIGSSMSVQTIVFHADLTDEERQFLESIRVRVVGQGLEVAKQHGMQPFNGNTLAAQGFRVGIDLVGQS